MHNLENKRLTKKDAYKKSLKSWPRTRFGVPYPSGRTAERKEGNEKFQQKHILYQYE